MKLNYFNVLLSKISGWPPRHFAKGSNILFSVILFKNVSLGSEFCRMGVSPVDVHDNNPNDRTLIGWRQKVGIRGESGDQQSVTVI